MSLPDDLLLLHPREAARRIALDLLDAADRAAPRLEDPDDAEALHDFRVAVRRLRSTLRAWRAELRGSVRKKDRQALRDLQQGTGAGRDAEVALAWLAGEAKDLRPVHRPGYRRLVERLESRIAASHASGRADVVAGYARIRDRLRRRLEVLQQEVHLGHEVERPRFGPLWARRLAEHVEDLAEHLARARSAADRAEAHAARIRLKRLRYLLEPAAPYAPSTGAAVKLAKRLQDVLGDLNDAHVLGDELGCALEAAAVEQARALHGLAQAGAEADVRKRSRPRARAGLLELTRRARARAESLFGLLSTEWLAAGLDALRQAAGDVARDLVKAAGAGREIERKYLLDALPPLEAGTPAEEIEQGWLPGATLRERVRCVRRDGEARYFRTVKLGAGVERTELEEETTREVFEALWPLTQGCRVRKRRHRVASGSREWEVDEFLDRDLVLAEVELDDPADEVVLPDWLGAHVVREVTTEKGYTNLELAR